MDLDDILFGGGMALLGGLIGSSMENRRMEKEMRAYLLAEERKHKEKLEREAQINRLEELLLNLQLQLENQQESKE